MRSRWNTSLSFGIVDVAIKVYSAREFGGAVVHQYHQGCAGSGEVGRQPYCKSCDKPIEWSQLVKGVEHDGAVVMVSDDELDECRGEATGLEILQFVPAEQVDPLLIDGADYLEPNTDPKRGGSRAAAKNYAVLVGAMQESDRAAICRFTNRGVSHIGVLRVHRDGKAMVLHTLVWASQVRAPEFEVLNKPVTITPEERKLAMQLIDSMVSDFDHAAFIDTYAEQVEAMVADKAAGVIAQSADQDDDGADVSDLLARLEESVKARESAAASKARHPAGKRKTA